MPDQLSFSEYMFLLTSQTLFALGQIPDPETGKTEIHLPMAQYSISILTLLEEKTRGNLSPEEAGNLRETLTQLRLAYVEASQKGGGKQGLA